MQLFHFEFSYPSAEGLLCYGIFGIAPPCKDGQQQKAVYLDLVNQTVFNRWRRDLFKRRFKVMNNRALQYIFKKTDLFYPLR